MDDLRVWATGPPAVVAPAVSRAAAAALRGFEELGLPVNVQKSVVLASTAQLATDLADGTSGIPVARSAMDLGVEVRTGRARGPAGGLAGRFATAIARARRVARLPIAPRRRAVIVAAAVIPVATYGALAAGATAAEVRRLRAAARAAIQPAWRWAAPEAVLAMDLPGGRADPSAAVGPAVLAQFARLLRGGHICAATVAAVGAGGRAAPRSGLVAAVRRAMRGCGIGGDPLRWALPMGPWPPEWCPAGEPSAHSAQLAAAVWERGQWAGLAARRAEFRDLSEGVDWGVWRAAIRGARLTPAQEGAVRAAAAGALVTEVRAAHWTGSAACPSCGAAREDLEHRLWTCPASEAVRRAAAAAAGLAPDALRRALGRSTSLTGLPAVAGGRAAGGAWWRGAGGDVPTDATARPAVWGSLGSLTELCAWTDASCLAAGCAAACGGWAVVWGSREGRLAPDATGGALVIAGPLRARPSAPRGELFAALAAVLAAPHVPLLVVSDSLGTCAGMRMLGAEDGGGRQPPPVRCPSSDGPNGDLWGLMAEALGWCSGGLRAPTPRGTTPS